MRPCVKNCGREAIGKCGRYCDECRSLTRRKNLKWKPTPEIDAIITEAYRTGYRQGASEFVSHKTGWPTWIVKKRALAIGIIRTEPKEPLWSAAEIKVLEEFVWMCPDRLRLKLKKVCGTSRTNTAILLKKKRLKLRVSDASGYSAHRLAGLFGVDPRGVIRRWVTFGWLKAVRRGSDRPDDAWYIEHADVYRFVLAHPEEIDLAKVDRLWFLDLVTQGKIGVRDEAAPRRAA